MNQPLGYSGPPRHRRFSGWEFALIAVAALVLLSVGAVVVGLVMSAASHGVMGGNK